MLLRGAVGSEVAVAVMHLSLVVGAAAAEAAVVRAILLLFYAAALLQLLLDVCDDTAEPHIHGLGAAVAFVLVVPGTADELLTVATGAGAVHIHVQGAAVAFVPAEPEPELVAAEAVQSSVEVWRSGVGLQLLVKLRPVETPIAPRCPVPSRRLLRHRIEPILGVVERSMTGTPANLGCCAVGSQLLEALLLQAQPLPLLSPPWPRPLNADPRYPSVADSSEYFPV